jgi:hypothetical protein
VPVDRRWSVPEDQGPEIGVDQDGNLLVTPRVVQDSDTDALAEAVWEAIAILRRVGGTIQIASQRGEIVPEVVVTESYVFAYHSFTPLVRKLDGNPVDNGLSDEIAAQFPEDSPGAEVVAEAQAEVAAAEDADHERAGAVVE